ncbi:MAG: hypothetical protein RR373_06870 [Akkermansia sp.]
MKSYQPIAALAVVFSTVLVSCETDRVNERPLGMRSPISSPTMAPTMGQEGQAGDSSLLNDVQNPSTMGSDLSGNAPSAQNPQQGSGTIANMLNNIDTPQSPASVPPSGQRGATSNGVQPLVPMPPAPQAGNNIPTAWPIPGDPTVVRSPYDSTKKVRILRKDGTRYASGTVLRDTNFKDEVRKFIVP